MSRGPVWNFWPWLCRGPEQIYLWVEQLVNGPIDLSRGLSWAPYIVSPKEIPLGNFIFTFIGPVRSSPASWAQTRFPIYILVRTLSTCCPSDHIQRNFQKALCSSSSPSSLNCLNGISTCILTDFLEHPFALLHLYLCLPLL